MVKVQLHWTGAASRKDCTGLLAERGHMLPVFSLVAPCTGRARRRSRRVSVRRGTFTTDWQRSCASNRPGAFSPEGTAEGFRASVLMPVGQGFSLARQPSRVAPPRPGLACANGPPSNPARSSPGVEKTCFTCHDSGLRGCLGARGGNPSTPSFAHSPSQIARPDKVVMK